VGLNLIFLFLLLAGETGVYYGLVKAQENIVHHTGIVPGYLV
jgi:hypothetical protein